jgi:hypothetical protein
LVPRVRGQPERNRKVGGDAGDAANQLQLSFTGTDGTGVTLHLRATMRNGKPAIVAMVARYPRSADIAASLPEMQRVSAWVKAEEQHTDAELRALGARRRSNN